MQMSESFDWGPPNPKLSLEEQARTTLETESIIRSLLEDPNHVIDPDHAPNHFLPEAINMEWVHLLSALVEWWNE